MNHDRRHAIHGTNPDAGLPAAPELRPEAGPLNTSAAWTSAVNGTWATKTDWSGGVVPTATTDATIAVAGSYTVTIAAAASAASLTLNSASAKVVDNAAFTVGTTLGLTAGTFTLGSSGVISGGTIITNGGSFIGTGGTLGGVAFDGALTETSGNLVLTGTDSFAGSGGTGSATINVTGQGAGLDIYDTQTLNNAAITIGNNNATTYFYFDSDKNAAQTLTLGSNLSITQTGSAYTYLYFDRSGNGDTLVNRGTITAGAKNVSLVLRDYYGAGSFTNAGTLAATNSGTLDLSANVTALGQISTTSGGVIILDSGETLSNAGTAISLSTASQLTLAGTVSGGTINDSGSGLIGQNGTLNGVTFDGTLNLANLLTLAGASTFAGSSGTGQATINVTGSGAALHVLDTQTLNTAAINLGNNNNQTYFNFDSDKNTAQTLTLGSTLSISQTANAYYSYLYFDTSDNGDTLVNRGTITAGAKGVSLDLRDYYGVGSFTNAGTLAATNGGTLEIESNVAALGKISTTGGGVILLGGTASNTGATLNLGAAAQLTLAGTINGGTISDSGGGLIGQSGTLNGVTYLGTLALTTPGAYLQVTGGLNVSTGGSVGTINITGQQADLLFVDTQTLDNANVTLGNNNYYAELDVYSDKAVGQTLTLGIHATITQAGTYAELQLDSGNTGNALINDGTIIAGVKNGILRIYGPYAGDSFTNAGSLMANNSGTIDLQTNVTTAGLGTFSTSGSGEVLLDSSYTLGNTGATLNLSTASQLTLAGTINGGTISDAGSGLIGAGGTLNAVTYLGTLALSTAGASLNVTGGLNVSTGGASGTINITGSNSSLNFYDTQTLDNATVNFGNNSGTSYFYFQSDRSAAQTLTLGSHLVLDQTGTYDSLVYGTAGVNSDLLINDGTIVAALKNASLTISQYYGNGYFANAGTLMASNSGTIDLQTDVSAGGLGTFSTSGGGVVLLGNYGSLNNTGATLNLSTASQLTLAGTINGGTISDAGTGLVAQGGTLNAVTYLGTLTLGASQSLTVTGGLNVSTGGSTGAVNLTGSNATLNFYDTQTLDNANVSLGTNSSERFYSDKAATQTLTLGSHLATSLAGTSAIIYIDNSNTGNALINDGTITAGVKNGQLIVYGAFANDSFTNNGTLIATNSGTLDLQTNVTTAGLGSFSTSSGGEILLDSNGTLTNTGATLNLSTASQLTLAGIINGGTISDAGSGLIGQGGTLNAVTYLGTLALTSSSASLDIIGGLNVSTGGASAVVNLTGSSANLQFTNTQTFDNTVVNIGTSGGTDSLFFNSTKSATQTLTLGNHLSISQAGANAQIYYDNSNSGNVLINDGTISGGFNGKTLSIIGPYTKDSFTNAGSLIATAGGTLNLASAGTLTNLSGTTLAGGSFEADAGSTLELASNVTITTDAATITLSGAGSTLQSLNTHTNTQTTLDKTLTTIAAGGTLAVFAGRNFTTAAAFTDSGSLQLAGGGTFTAASGLAIGAGGSLSGNGKVAAAVTNNGSIEAKGGVLTVTGAVSGTGSLQVDANATFEFGAAVAATQTAAFSGQGGTFKLDAPLNFSATLAGFAAGDTLDLTGVTASSAFTNGATLDVALGNGGTLAFNLAAALAAERFAAVGDGNGGTDVVGYRYATASVMPTSLTLGNVHVGDADSAGITLTNTAPSDGYSENLDAAFSGASGGAIDSGSISLLAAGASNGSALSVGIGTSGAGTISGSATLALSTDGAGKDGQSGLSIGSQTIAVSGAVYAYASGTLATSNLAFGNHHVGDLVSQALTLTNAGAATGGYTEGLDATLSGATGGITASGSLSLLTQGASDASSLTLGLNTATAGAISGSATLTLASDGSGLDGLGTTALAPVSVAASGGVFAYAAARLASTTINLGIRHVGDSIGQALTLTNAGPATGGYTEALDAMLSGGTGGVSGSGSISGLGAGASDGSSLIVGLASSSSGVESGTVTLGAASDGSGIDGLGTTTLGSQIVSVTGTIDNYATLTVEQVVGKTVKTIANGGTIDLGSVAKGGKALSVTLGMLNAATGTADVLGGTFATSGKGFTLKNFGSFAGLGAGQDERMQVVSLKTGTAGTFKEVITVKGVGSNASGYSGALTPETITIVGTVTASAAAFLPSASVAVPAGFAPLSDAAMVPRWEDFGPRQTFAAPDQQAAMAAPALGSLSLQPWSQDVVHATTLHGVHLS